MKNKFLNYSIPTFLLAIALFIIGPSCGNNIPDPVANTTCDTTNSMFSDLYNNIDASSTGISETWLADNKIYEYQFTIDSSKRICSIGLEGSDTAKYTIEISSANNVLPSYSGTHDFSVYKGRNYVKVTSIQLYAGQQYTLRRKTKGFAGSMTKGLAGIQSKDFPLILKNGITIHSADLYDSIGVPGKTFTNKVLPNIDIIFI